MAGGRDELDFYVLSGGSYAAVMAAYAGVTGATPVLHALRVRLMIFIWPFIQGADNRDRRRRSKSG